MKKLKIFFCAFLAVATLVSCEEEENLDPLGEWELSAPVLVSPEATIILDEDKPSENIAFSWDPAISSERYQVRYSLVIDSLGSENYGTPILSKASELGGRETEVSFTASEIDLALSYAGFDANSNAEVEIAVVAQSIDKEAIDVQKVIFKRFEKEYKPQQLFLFGSGTEAGTDISQAIPLRALKDAAGNLTYQFEVFMHLEAGGKFRLSSNQQMPAHIYGGSEGKLIKSAAAISVPEAGEYKLTVDLEEGSYDLMKIDHLSIVGDVIPNGWGGDEALEYQGNGTWQREMYLQTPEGGQGAFILRINGDWANVLKRIAGTQNQLYMESQAEEVGIQVEDIPLVMAGDYTVTVDLSGESYTYTLEKAETGGTPPSETPEELYLLADGEIIATFTKEENIFKSKGFVPLQVEVTYQLNSVEDGSGTAYHLSGVIGGTSNPDGDSVFGTLGLVEGTSDIAVARDQAYQMVFNFDTASASWKYYNIKLFHWDEAGGDWDDRDELLMTYEHPLQFTTTQNLEAGYAMKFNSPWEVQFGPDDPTALSGTMTNGETANFQNITTSGTYTVNIEVSNDFQTGTYEFISE